jgi:hypothetical protein
MTYIMKRWRASAICAQRLINVWATIFGPPIQGQTEGAEEEWARGTPTTPKISTKCVSYLMHPVVVKKSSPHAQGNLSYRQSHSYPSTQTISATPPCILWQITIFNVRNRNWGSRASIPACWYHIPYATQPYMSISRTNESHFRAMHPRTVSLQGTSLILEWSIPDNCLLWVFRS